MNLWNYDIIPDQIDPEVGKLLKCLFCDTNLETEIIHRSRNEPNILAGEKLTVNHCLQCGWWNAEHYEKGPAGIPDSFHKTKVAYGILKQLNLNDISLPIQEIRDYLTIKYEKIKLIHPKLMEDVVGSVFKDLGFITHVTNYSGDGGIDVILYDSNSKLIGVQVKRFKNSIKANQIRELTGALLLGGFTKGIFITTSEFQKGAIKTAQISNAKGIPIELIDSKRFYDALKLSQLNVERDKISWDSYNFDKFKLTEYNTFMETYYLK